MAGAASELLIEHCDSCARWVHPATGHCPDCGGQLVARAVSGRGTVFTYTVNLHPYHPDIPTPYVIAIVELAEQQDLRVATNIVDCEADSIVCGMPVEVRFQHPPGPETAVRPVFVPAARSTT